MKNLAFSVILFTYLLNLGCSSVRQVPPSKTKPGEYVVAAIYPSGHVVTFKETQGKKGTKKVAGIIDTNTRTVLGVTTAGETVSIPLDSLLYVRVKRVDAVKTTFAVLGIIVSLVLVAAVAAVASSCPFVYSFDGKDYVLDAEPLGGVVSKGMESSDLARLEHLRPVDGVYRLLMRNETEETQYLNETKLLVVDHPANTRVVADFTGKPHVIGNVATPSRAVDEAGNDIRPFFESPDEIAWQTRMPIDDSWRRLPRRHELTFEVPRLGDATSANLVVKAGTALWGSEMIRKMLELRGDGLDEWYRSIDSNGAAVDELIAFNQREELYFLKLYVLVGDQWVFRAWIPGGGPLVTEERVIPIDLAGVTGDIVKMRVLPPRGFWSLDFLGLEFSHHPTPEVVVVPLKRAIAHDHMDVTAAMSAVDDRRHVMPLVGDEITLEFAAPEMPASGNRTVFLDIHGYYLVHIDQTQPEKKGLIAELLRNDGQIVEYSLDVYMKWRTGLLSRN